jgi:hypothetical protein
MDVPQGSIRKFKKNQSRKCFETSTLKSRIGGHSPAKAQLLFKQNHKGKSGK